MFHSIGLEAFWREDNPLKQGEIWLADLNPTRQFKVEVQHPKVFFEGTHKDILIFITTIEYFYEVRPFYTFGKN
jgi:hypothetical protein